MIEKQFSRRYGYSNEVAHPVLEDAPEQVRQGLREVLAEYGYKSPSAQRRIICKALRVRPDPDNWSEYPNVESEVSDILHNCEWYKFYDMCERIARDIGPEIEDADAGGTYFQTLLNNLFQEENVGYRMHDGAMNKVGSDEFNATVGDAEESLQDSRYSAPQRQLTKALAFRNSLPPDYPNAVKEAVNAVEGTWQVVADMPGVALPTILTSLDQKLPSGLKKLYDGLYGYASGSEGARHSSVGGHVPAGEEAELIIHTAAAAISYAISRYGGSSR